MASYRCPRCWISCDTRAKAKSHYTQSNCKPRDVPIDGPFMDLSLEHQVEEFYFGKISEENAWWTIFRILIPDVGQMDDSMLKIWYSPCKPIFHPVRGLVI